MLVQMWQKTQDSLGKFIQELFDSYWLSKRETEKSEKKQILTADEFCCSIISSCVKFNDSKPLPAAVLWIMMDLLLNHLGSLYPQHSLSFSCCSPMFSSEQKYFSAWLEVFRWFNTNSLELFRTSEVHSTSPMYFALKNSTKNIVKRLFGV